MSEEKLQYEVLLDKKQEEEKRGLRLGGGELRGAHFYREGKTGVADSIQAVQDTGLLQVPTYAFAKGRVHVGVEDSERVWNNWHDGLGERLTLNVDQSYRGIPKGEYVVDIQGGGIFMPRHEAIRRAISDGTMRDRAFPVSKEDKDLLLGERQVYRGNGTEVEKVPVQYFFTSFEEFDDVSGTPEFVKALNDMSAVYTVLRPVSEARQNLSGWSTIEGQLRNPDLVIPLGGKAPLRRMLMEKVLDEETGEEREVPRFGWERFGSWHDGYQNLDSGRVGLLDSNNDGVNWGNVLDDDGCSVGVAPEALEAWRGAPRASVEAVPTLDEILALLRSNMKQFEQGARSLYQQ